MAGNNDMCYWGLPSISADDSAGVLTNHLGYWRGFVWGPLSILTYWSLQEYDHVPEVHHGRSSHSRAPCVSHSGCSDANGAAWK
jgi:hypothetical protein